MSALACLPLKIVESAAGASWGLLDGFIEHQLGDIHSNLVANILFPHIEKIEDPAEEPAFKSFFYYDPVLEYMNKSPEPSSIIECNTPNNSLKEAEFKDKFVERFRDKIEQIDQLIKNIDPALIGQKRSQSSFFLIRIVQTIRFIFKRIFTSNIEINRLFFCQRALKIRLEDFKATYPEAVKTIIKPTTQEDQAKIMREIEKIIKDNFAILEEAEMILYVLQNGLPQKDFSLFEYDKETCKFTIKYLHNHHYLAHANLESVQMGYLQMTIICEDTVQGRIEKKKKQITFKTGFHAENIIFLDLDQFFFPLRKLAEAITANSKKKKPPKLEFVQMKEQRKIKVQGSAAISFVKIPEKLIAPLLSYQKVKANLSKINWRCPD